MFAELIAPLVILKCEGILLDNILATLSLRFSKHFISKRLFQSHLVHQYRQFLYNGRTLILILYFKILRFSSHQLIFMILGVMRWEDKLIAFSSCSVVIHMINYSMLSPLSKRRRLIMSQIHKIILLPKKLFIKIWKNSTQ